MKTLLDKVILILLAAFVFVKHFKDMQLVIMIFVMVTAAFLTSYLRMIGNKFSLINKIFVLIAASICIFIPKAVFILPIIIYEAYFDRHYGAGLISFVAIINALNLFQPQEIIYITFIMILAGYMAYKTDVIDKNRIHIKKIRDEGEIKNELLKHQNIIILEEQDKNIYTAQLAERNRIAREIHDNVGHMLSRSLLQVGAMMVVHKEEAISQELKDLRNTLDTAMNNIRESVHDIRDDAIDIEISVNEMLKPLESKFNLNFECDVENDNMSKEIKYAIINIVKEAVSNIIKYSDNDSVDIRIDEHPSMYQIIVRDYDSLGHSKDNEGEEVEIDHRGMGLDNIIKRAEQFNGQAYFTKGNGFRVFVRLGKNI
ncbi:histidine kinase [Eubacterium sp.]|uniref:histidine kinase n=1 Tax=Eubacterium sp. TaxID=142586 RepID=UPI00258A8D3D|nr:histidine kinase [Eubacterium sp.]MCR5369065.1 hypothetical protein [Eubacterium sp.]